MRLAPFLTVSVALHAGVLVYPIAFYRWRAESPIAVTILPLEPEFGGAGSNGSKGKNATRALPGPTPRLEQVGEAGAKTKALSESVAPPPLIEVPVKAAETNFVFTGSRSHVEGFAAASGSGSAGYGNGGNGMGTTGTGPGSRSGSGPSQSSSVFTQARYSDTPKPVYPELARRDGREGRVLLRVLIDDRGEAIAVEVSRSSGSDALDQAATSAIKRWRFHPARSGDQPIESWVSVPIDFKLTDAKN